MTRADAFRDFAVTLLVTFAACVLIALACLGGCSKTPAHVDPVREEFATSEQAHAAAIARASSALGQHVYGPTHGTSMEPIIYAGDFVVLQERAFSEVREGKAYGYLPKPGDDFPRLAKDYNARPVHRAITFTNGGWLMSGDSVPLSDSNVRMTAENLVGECVYVAHVKRPISSNP